MVSDPMLTNPYPLFRGRGGKRRPSGGSCGGWNGGTTGESCGGWSGGKSAGTSGGSCGGTS